MPGFILDYDVYIAVYVEVPYPLLFLYYLFFY